MEYLEESSSKTTTPAVNNSQQISGNVDTSQIAADGINKKIAPIDEGVLALVSHQSFSNRSKAEENERDHMNTLNQLNKGTESDHVVGGDFAFSSQKDSNLTEIIGTSKHGVNASDNLDVIQSLGDNKSCQCQSNNEIMPVEAFVEDDVKLKINIEISGHDHYKIEGAQKSYHKQSHHKEKGTSQETFTQVFPENSETHVGCQSLSLSEHTFESLFNDNEKMDDDNIEGNLDSEDNKELIKKGYASEDRIHNGILNSLTDQTQSETIVENNVLSTFSQISETGKANMEVSSSDEKRKDLIEVEDYVKPNALEETQNEKAIKILSFICETQKSSEQGKSPYPDLSNDLSSGISPSVSSLMNHTSVTFTNSKSNLHDHRSDKSLVVYSDSEDSTSSDSECFDKIDNDGDSGSDVEELRDVSQVRKSASTSKNDKYSTRARTNGEVFPEELPPLDYLTISVPEELELVVLGKVSGIVNILVVIQALEDTPALYDDSVLFLENRQPLGLIFETIGTVHRPFYTVRFNSEEDIKERGISIGDKVLYAPKADNLTKYIFISELRKAKCDDASWKNDNEPPEWVKEFSDDEEERKAMKAKKSEKRNKRDVHDQTETGHKPHLKPGDLNKNPFGKRKEEKGHKSDPNIQSIKNQKSSDYNKVHRGSQYRATHASSNLPHNSGAFRGSMNGPPVPAFGGKPSWQPHPAQPRPMHPSTQLFPFDNNFDQIHGHQSFQTFHSVGEVPRHPFPVPNVNPSFRPAYPPPDFSRPPPVPSHPPMLNDFGFRNQTGQMFMNNDVNAPLFSSPSTVFQSHMTRNNRTTPNFPNQSRSSYQ